MNLHLIKIFGITIVTICCLIAAYTDVKSQIIPNKLTFTTIILGIFLVSVFYILTNHFNYFYYISILMVYGLSYVLWRLGVWAGGDVKLLTAISTLLIPEFLDIIPSFDICGITFPFNLALIKVPILLLLFNTILSILPVVLIYVSVIITKDKSYLINRLISSYNLKEVLLSLNSLHISYTIISGIGVYQPLEKIIFLLIISYLISKIMKIDVLLTIFTIIILLQQLFAGNVIEYLVEFIIISIMVFVKNVYQNKIIKEALTDNISVFELEEGMILQYPLYFANNEYFFDKSSWYSIKEKGERICSNNACGLTNDEIQLLKEVCDDSEIPIKKGLTFAPFILFGLLITLVFGNTYQLFIKLWGMI